jgi:ribosomal protein S18 acetylase RimI-like enzyme
MAAAGRLASAPRAANGLRPVHPRRDLAPIADLVETCFGPSLDAAGRAVIQEMRLLSHAGPFLWLLAQFNRALPLMRGFVWVQDGRIVGNVTVTPTGYDRGWVIANVAVYPEFRRRGIARQLMGAALEYVRARGRFATLQVDTDNQGAQALYAGLGFETQRVFRRWRRPAHLIDLPELPCPAGMRRLATSSDADALCALATRARPNALGGMGWLRPTRRRSFSPPRYPELSYFLSGQRADFWIVPGANNTLDAALRVEYRLGGMTALADLLIDPARAGLHEAALINFAQRQMAPHVHALVIDHPADDTITEAALRAQHFSLERALTHMIWRH